jgi:polysaccharide biosynthesis transport protein
LLESLPAVREARDRIAANRTKAEEHRQRSVDPSRNTMLAQLEKQIKQDEEALEKSLEAEKASLKEDLEKSARDKRQHEIARMQAELRLLETTTKYLREKTEQERKARQEVVGDRLQLELAKQNMSGLAPCSTSCPAALWRCRSSNRRPNGWKSSRSPQPRRGRTKRCRSRKWASAGLAALLVPFGMAVGIEILFRRVSSRQQLEEAGNIAVVAEVTSLPSRGRSKRIDSAPNRERQLFEESIDGLRTYLSLVDSMHGHKTLAITSAISREGKTSLAAQLAASIAASTHRPTLLIDGDMRSPDIHRIFDIDLGPGLCEVLKGSCPVEEAIETGFSNTLHLLTAGDLHGSPHRILGNGAFADLLEKLRGMYDYIVVDTPPILAASEALLMARAADAAVLCVRRDFSRVDQVKDAFGRLRTAGVKTAGAVLNGIPPRHYAYRYGSYYYTRGRQSVDASPDVESTASEVTAG